MGRETGLPRFHEPAPTTARPEGPGRVSLVGAGPGDPGLITWKGMERLRQADVVVYDRLIAPSLLGEAPLHAERICAAKAPGAHRLEQEAIHAILLREARLGRRVVRLKGGDPFVFGRGGEEALALKEAGIPFEVIPGVTSAVAVPAYAGIPVTHRGLSAGFAVWAGRRALSAPSGRPAHAGGRQESDSPGESCGASPSHDSFTQVILMGVGGLDGVVASLLREGWAPATPAAIVSWGTTGRQRAVVAPLEKLASEASAQALEPPATVIVGEVAGLSHALEWWKPPTGPYAGERVALLRAAGPGDSTYDALTAGGAEVAVLPLTSGSDWVGPVARCLCDLAAEEMIDRFVFPSERLLAAFIAARESLALGPLEPLLARAHIEEGDGSLRPLNLPGSRPGIRPA